MPTPSPPPLQCNSKKCIFAAYGKDFKLFLVLNNYYCDHTFAWIYAVFKTQFSKKKKQQYVILKAFQYKITHDLNSSIKKNWLIKTKLNLMVFISFNMEVIFYSDRANWLKWRKARQQTILSEREKGEILPFFLTSLIPFSFSNDFFFSFSYVLQRSSVGFYLDVLLSSFFRFIGFFHRKVWLPTELLASPYYCIISNLYSKFSLLYLYFGCVLNCLSIYKLWE